MELGPQKSLRRTLEVARGGEWFRLDGRLTELSSRRAPLRAMLATLAHAHPDLVTAGELIEAAWPNECLTGTSARNRLHVAIHALRKLGLAEVILKGRKAYRIDPEVRVQLCEEAGA